MPKMIIVDCEADGPCPGKGNLTEIGAVLFSDTTKRFHGRLRRLTDASDSEYAKIGGYHRPVDEYDDPREVMVRFDQWIKTVTGGDRPIMVSDNPAFDFMWIAYYFHHLIGHNPFGHSARRIGDIHAGVVGDLRRPWKHLRDTPHDHNPVNDALGNAEALAKILRMMEERT